ncbi:MAG: helix-turn-helix transcriptional regulator [Candidatus Acidiferrales bacterium]
MNDLLLLATLLTGPQHGYALKKKAVLISGQADMHNNLVYPLLRRFVREGWVTRKETAGQRGQTRQVYSLTSRGRQALVQRLCNFSDGAAASSDEFRLRVGLFPVLGSSARAAILDKRQSYLLNRAQRFGPLQREMDLGAYGAEVVRFIRRQIAAELAWIARLRRIARRASQRKAAGNKE